MWHEIVLWWVNICICKFLHKKNMVNWTVFTPRCERAHWLSVEAWVPPELLAREMYEQKCLCSWLSLCVLIILPKQWVVQYILHGEVEPAMAHHSPFHAVVKHSSCCTGEPWKAFCGADVRVRDWMAANATAPSSVRYGVGGVGNTA